MTEHNPGIDEATGDTIDANLEAAEANGLGGTEADGNVYSVGFDPESQQLAFKCVTAGGDTWLTFVSAGTAGLAFLPAEGDPLTLTLENDGIKINGTLIDPTQPWPGA